MFDLPDKFKRNPFMVWGFIVATIVIFVFLFGQEEIMNIIHWSIGMSEDAVVIEGNGR